MLKHFGCCFVLLSAVVCAGASLSVSEPEAAKGKPKAAGPDLGASIKRVWFRGDTVIVDKSGGNAKPDAATAAAGSSGVQGLPDTSTPLVGIEIDLDKLALAIDDQLGTDSNSIKSGGAVNGIRELLKAHAKDPAMWSVYKAIDDTKPCDILAVFVESKAQQSSAQTEGKSGLVLILGPTWRFDDAYKVHFELSQFLRLTPAKDEADGFKPIVSRPVSWTGRFTLAMSTDFSTKPTTLISGQFVGGKFVGTSTKAVQVGFSATYDGFPNFIRRVLPEHSFDVASLDGTISENRLDQASRISFEMSGVTDVYGRPRDAAVMTGLEFDTSQSLREQTMYYEVGLRLGDARTSAPDGGYVPSDKALCPVYIETALQVGGSRINPIADVPAPQRDWQFIVRPRARLGFSNLSGAPCEKKPIAQLTGYFDVYEVSKDVGGADDAEGFPAARVGLKGHFLGALTVDFRYLTLALSVEGGTNPAQGFVDIPTTYGLKVGFKF